MRLEVARVWVVHEIVGADLSSPTQFHTPAACLPPACQLPRLPAGEAPVFRIIEASSGGALSSLPSFGLFSGRPHTLTLRAGGIEECMDWAIGLREAIAACTS